MFSALLPMVLFPTAFVIFGVWWFVRHVQGRNRFKTTSEVSRRVRKQLAVGVSKHERLQTRIQITLNLGNLETNGDNALIGSGSRASKDGV